MVAIVANVLTNHVGDVSASLSPEVDSQAMSRFSVFFSTSLLTSILPSHPPFLPFNDVDDLVPC